MMINELISRAKRRKKVIIRVIRTRYANESPSEEEDDNESPPPPPGDPPLWTTQHFISNFACKKSKQPAA